MLRWLGVGVFAVLVAGNGFASHREGDVVVFRTAGQPERQLKILRVSQFSDGESLIDVQDLTTGDRFTVPGKVMAALSRPRTPPTPQPTPVAPPTQSSAKPLPPPPVPLTTTQPATPPPQPSPANPPAPETVATPVAEASATPIPAPVEPAEPGEIAQATATPSAPSQPETSGNARFQSPISQTSREEIPQTRQSLLLTSLLTPQEQMYAEIKPLIADLHTALRPTVREDAATGLAEGRYGSRPEVKATIAYAAMSDPAISVRAHCIRCLMSLGYHHPVYVDYLQKCAVCDSVELKQAAIVALQKLRPR